MKERVVALSAAHARYIEALAKRGVLGTTTREVVHYLLATALSDVVGSGFVQKLEETRERLGAVAG